MPGRGRFKKGGYLGRPGIGMTFSEWALAKTHSQDRVDVYVRRAQMSTPFFPIAMGEHEIDFGGDDSLL